ncbi:hypothetical protein [Lentzea flava]|uniref:DUF3558 domain-containing protein n=1 Tax=Lentzea flava TaxID=103732 RepID=A0ABQ2V5R3_9PSEU|nr:hypothetical protein [Lentzea flava]MCP2203102.1 hypothetical protein [Lentzea flava]GGU66178.1 hypothetical protein GCM10010178_67660 [Lentzea flava]
MNQPPPHGWQQQPPPPHGWQPQQPPGGWQQQPPPPGWQQPGYGYPPQPPRKKSKAPIIIVSILVGLLVLGGGGIALFFYLHANRDGGGPKRNDALPALCGNVSEAALAKARTTNPNGLGSSERDSPTGKNTRCSWNQTRGVDGSGLRETSVYVMNVPKDAGREYQQKVQQAMSNTQGTMRQKPLDGLGDEATAVLLDSTSAYMDLTIYVRKGDNVVEVNYIGWDVGIFTNKKPDAAEFEAAALSVAQEMVAKL